MRGVPGSDVVPGHGGNARMCLRSESGADDGLVSLRNGGVPGEFRLPRSNAGPDASRSGIRASGHATADTGPRRGLVTLSVAIDDGGTALKSLLCSGALLRALVSLAVRLEILLKGHVGL